MKTRENMKTRKNMKTRENMKTRKNIKYGGKVIGSGGYGCILRPALKCSGKARQKNQISKIMTTRHLREEYNDIVKFKPFLEKIPNYSNYFFIDNVYTCTPDKLTDKDLKDFDIKCKALKKEGFYSDNINKSLDKIGVLNMPDGGLDVGDFIDTITQNTQFIDLNNSLIDLLLHGIIPMNKYNIYHCDIKEGNILVDTKKEFHTKIIDWGLSAKYDGKKIPSAMTNRPLQYNLPFSNIIFNEIFEKTYKKFLEKNPSPNQYSLRAFVVDYIFLWNEKRGAGHIKYMINIMTKLFENDLPYVDKENLREIIEMEFLYHYIIDYITKILVKFTNNNKFMIKDYFNNVFLKNIDVWGLVMTYYPIINILHDNFQELDKTELNLFYKLKHIYIHYLFESAAEPINIDNLVKDLKELNVFFKQSAKSSREKSITSLVKTSKQKKMSKKSKQVLSKRTSIKFKHLQKTKKQPRTLLFIESKK